MSFRPAAQDDLETMTTRNGSRWWKPDGRLLFCALVAAVSLSGVSGCTHASEKAPDRDASSRTSPSGAAKSYPPPSHGGEVKLVDVGLSVVEHGGERLVSYGVVLENRSSKIADSTAIEIRLINTAGKPVPFGSDADRLRNHVDRLVWAMKPGERYGIGDIAYVDPLAPEASKPVRAQVRLGWTEWVADSNTYPRPNLSVTDPEFDGRRNGATLVRFNVNSPYSESVPGRCVVVVFRNASGSVVGGAHPSQIEPEEFRPNRITKALGQVPYVPPGAVDAVSEMYASVVCDEPRD